jgi:hypothetical protein
MDTNAPPEDHWWAVMSGEVQPPDWLSEEERRLLIKPKNWEFFTQEPAMLEIKGEDGHVLSYAMNPNRANQALPDKYYLNMLPGKSRTWINIYVLNRYGQMLEGKPVYPEWSDEIHIASERLEPRPSHSITVGADFGRTPAAAFTQEIDGRTIVFHELVLSGVSTQTFASLLKREITRRGWHGYTFRFFGDPSGDDMAQTRDETSMQIMRAAGLKFVGAPTNDPQIRIEATAALLTKMTPKGPAFLVSPHCKNLIAGFRGGYQFKEVAGSHGRLHETKPYKNRHSHVHDGLQYAIVGSGAWTPVIRGTKPYRSVTVSRIGNPFTRQAQRAGTGRWANR